MVEPTSLDISLRALGLLEGAAGPLPHLPDASLVLLRQRVEPLEHQVLARLVTAVVVESARAVWQTADERVWFQQRVAVRRLRLMVGPL